MLAALNRVLLHLKQLLFYVCPIKHQVFLDGVNNSDLFSLFAFNLFCLNFINFAVTNNGMAVQLGRFFYL